MTRSLKVVHVIREALEGVLTPDLAASVFFESLNGPEGVPESREDVLSMVRGPMFDSLATRVGRGEANAVVDRILATLEPGAGQPKRRRDEDATVAVPLEDRPVPVGVVASHASLSNRLEYALGPNRIEVLRVGHPDDIGASGATIPELVIVDAEHFPPHDVGSLAGSLAALPDRTIRVVWGAELRVGQGCVEAIRGEGQDVVALDRMEGVEPMLDLIRSRHRGS